MTAAQPDGNGKQLVAELERFVVDNDDLLALEALIGRFNIFDALGIARAEIRHSNFLAFILDPAESHGQGQLFLKAVLMDLLKAAPAASRPFSPIELDGTDLRGVEVRREWKHIDLLITCKQPQFVVVVENKVDSGEHSDQLKRYDKEVGDSYPGVPALRVYLTPDGEAPSEEAWVPYTYADVHRVLRRVRDTNRAAIGDDVLVFLDHYLNLLGTRFMNDEKIDELCRRIYKNHRQALDLIWERVGSPGSSALRDVVDDLQKGGQWYVYSASTDRNAFLMPTSWLGWLPPLGTHDEDEPKFWIYLNLFVVKDGSFRSAVYVGPMADTVKRQSIVAKLREECPLHGFRRTRSSTADEDGDRITASESVEVPKTGGSEPAEIREALKKKLDELLQRFERLAKTVKALCAVTTGRK